MILGLEELDFDLDPDPDVPLAYEEPFKQVSDWSEEEEQVD